jgi:DME family drug/metabolite transporter
MLRGVVLIALAAVSWGTTGAVTSVLVARAGAHPLLIGALRMAIAGAFLLLGAWLATGSIRVARRDRYRCVAAGACMAGFQATFFTAVTLSGIAVSALVAICSAPLIIALLAARALGERLTGRTQLALGLGVAGTALLVLGPGAAEAEVPRMAAGVALALGAGLAYGLYVVVTKSGLAGTAPLPLTAATFSVAAVLMAPALLWIDGPMRQVALGWPWLLYIGAVATAGAYALYSIGLTRVPASTAGIVSLCEPLTATLMGVLLFGERLGAGGVAGVALLGGSLALLLTQRERARP